MILEFIIEWLNVALVLMIFLDNRNPIKRAFLPMLCLNAVLIGVWFVVQFNQ